MLICGIKLSHDAGVAVVEDGKVLFSIEVEKLENGHRYSSLGDLGRVGQILKSEGIDPADIGQFVVDGWFVRGVDDIEVTDPAVLAARGGGRVPVPVAPYQDRRGGKPLARYSFTGHSFGSSTAGYASYHHVSNHVLGGYCSSPFAARGEDALVLVWDGGTAPRLYAVTAATGTVRWITDLLPLTGDIFGEFSSHLAPFFRDTSGFSADQIMRHHLSVAGQAMAYAALGRVEEGAFGVFDDILAGFPDVSAENSKAASLTLIGRRGELLPGLSDADLIATFQEYLGGRLRAEHQVEQPAAAQRRGPRHLDSAVPERLRRGARHRRVRDVPPRAAPGAALGRLQRPATSRWRYPAWLAGPGLRGA
jgi:carbamoyltransferase